MDESTKHSDSTSTPGETEDPLIKTTPLLPKQVSLKTDITNSFSGYDGITAVT